MPWNWALGLAAVLFLVVAAGRVAAPAYRPGARAFLRESGVVAVLYATWRLAGTLSLGSVGPANDRGLWVWDAERTVHLPSEASLQHLLLPVPGLARFANLYYIGCHVPVMGIFLVWCFLRHRDAYPAWRTRLALLTGACLFVQMLLPLAPPRLVESHLIVDTGLRWGPTVYEAGGGGFADQLSSMPSLHVGWALIVGIGAVTAGRSRWRWLGAAHLVATVLVVVVTGNHYWFDGLAALALLVLVIPVQLAGSRCYAAVRSRLVATGHPVFVPIPEPVAATS